MQLDNYGPDTYSINPILPSYEFIPDGEPRIFGDRMYLYGSHDLYDSGEMCLGDYICYSADANNPIKWRYEGVIYERSKDPYIKQNVDKGKASMMNANLFAPDVLEIEGKYYMYYGVGLSKAGFGVAFSDSPVGPFEYIGRVRYPESEKPTNWIDNKDGINDGDLAFGYGYSPIQLKPGRGFGINISHYPYDPAVLYDKGRLYLYFGLGYCRVVELDIGDKRTVLKNENTGKYESEILVPPFFPTFDKTMNKRQTDGMGMVNAPSIRVVNGRYCLSYYAKGPNKSDAMCHAFSDSPFGPFKYSGTLVSLGNASYKNQKTPTDYVGNTHGGLVKVGETWYTIYHRQTGNRAPGRQACATALTLGPDGQFEHSEYTSLGFSKDAVPAYYVWPAYMACYLTDAHHQTKKNSKSPYILLENYPGGEIDIDTKKEVLQLVTNLTDGSIVGYKYFDFGNEENIKQKIEITAKVESKSSIDVCLDSPDLKNRIARIELPADNKWNTYSNAFDSITGIHSVYFIINTQEKLGDLSLIEFKK